MLTSLATAVRGQDVSASALVDSTNFLVGDWITVHVELKHPAGIRFLPLLGDTLGGFAIIQRPVLDTTHAVETRTDLIVARYDSGMAELPPIPFGYRLPDDTTYRTVSTNSLVFVVHTVDVDTSKEFKDVKPPLSIALTFAEIALYAGIILALAVIGYFAYKYWKKRQQKSPVEAYVSPAKPAHVLALEELGVLKEKKLWQQGLIKQYYSEATDIVRRYFENRYRIMALEQTTDEIMQSLRSHPHAEPILAETEEMLRLSDLVKFAKMEPGISDHERLLTVAYDIVDRTKQVAAVVSAVQVQPESANVDK